MAPTPRVVVIDPQPPDTWDYERDRDLIAARGATLLVLDDPAERARALGNAAVVVTHEAYVGAHELDSWPFARGIVATGTGLDRIDIAAADDRGVTVRNLPGYCTQEVAEHAVALVLACWRRLPYWQGQMTQPAVPVADVRRVRRLHGTQAGVLGGGRIGGLVAKMLIGLGLEVFVHDPFIEQAPHPKVQLADRDTLFRMSQVLVCCAPLTDRTKGLVGGAALRSLPEGAVFVNVSRGSIVDEPALEEALRSGHLAAAGLDVRAVEPVAADDGLLGLPNVIHTPHVAWASAEAEEALHTYMADAVSECLAASPRTR